MAYKLNQLAIVPGSLNLLEPSDSAPQNESLDLTDFWPGAAGKLEQAPQPLNVYAPGVALDGVMRTGPSTYCAGSGNIYLKEAGAGYIGTGYGIAYPTGMIAFQGYMWATSQSKQARYSGATELPWTLAAPTVAPTVTSVTTHPGKFYVSGASDSMYPIPMVFYYYYTWEIPGIGESNPSPSGSALAVDGQGFTIAHPTGTGIPAGVTHWNLYREVPAKDPAVSGGGAGVPYKINSAPMQILDLYDPFPDTGMGGDAPHQPYAGAPYNIVMTEDGLLAQGIILEGNHDPAPAAAIMGNQTFNGRIVVGNSAAHPNRIWWTQPYEPAFFRGSTTETVGDWLDVGTDDKDEIRAIIVRPGMLVVYRAKSIWRHMGDLGDVNADLEPACLDVGIAGARAVASTAAGDYFVGTGGDSLYRFNNDWPLKLSQKIEPLLRGLPAPDANFGQQNITQAKLCAVGHYRGRLYLSYTPLSAPEASFILHLESGRWFACSQLYRAFQDAGDTLLAGSVDGLYAVENAYGNTATNLAFQSQYLDCGSPDHEKTFADLVVMCNTRGQNLTLKLRTNKNADPEMDMGHLNTTVMSKVIIPMLYPSGPLAATPIKAFNISVRIEGSGFTTPQVIDSPLLLHYYLEARRGRTFDTGLTTHGLDGVGTIDQFELDIDASSGTCAVAIWSDIPGGVLAVRTPVGGLTIDATSGRQVIRYQLITPIYGRLFRHQIYTTTDFQLYGFRVRMLPIGVHLDGSNPFADFWYTTPQAVGV